MLIWVGIRFDFFVYGLKFMFFDRYGFGLWRVILYLILKIEKIKLDIIYLYNFYGYYLNCEVLFDYLFIVKIFVVWILYDCWSFMGYCVYF